jgi:hypothetical protein
MQISSNHSGFNFSSVYKSVVTRESPAQHEPAPVSSSSKDIPHNDDDQVAKMHREALMLQAAHRAAERTADQIAATPEL